MASCPVEGGPSLPRDSRCWIEGKRGFWSKEFSMAKRPSCFGELMRT